MAIPALTSPAIWLRSSPTSYSITLSIRLIPKQPSKMYFNVSVAKLWTSSINSKWTVAPQPSLWSNNLSSWLLSTWVIHNVHWCNPTVSNFSIPNTGPRILMSVSALRNWADGFWRKKECLESQANYKSLDPLGISFTNPLFLVSLKLPSWA